MGLRDYNVPRTSVPVGDTEVSVRGIAFSEVMYLADTYGPQITIMFNKVQKGGELQSKDVRSIIGELAKEAPQMVAATIALAADDFDETMVDKARMIPFPIQLDLCEAIFRLTFASEADVKKLIESVTRVITGVSGALNLTASVSQIGTGDSDGA